MRKTMTISLTSSAFIEGAMIPQRYSCDGEDISPPIAWSNVPPGTRSFALICDDPDAPVGTWDHWVVYNIPAHVTSLNEGIAEKSIVDNGAVHGNNSWGRIGYGGPCPPSGTHRYFFKIFALDTLLDLKSGSTSSQLVNAMEGHILAQGQLMGRYQR
jgi:Raf kinase inhibitor-like YbhB/YbcL family protein